MNYFHMRVYPPSYDGNSNFGVVVEDNEDYKSERKSPIKSPFTFATGITRIDFVTYPVFLSTEELKDGSLYGSLVTTTRPSFNAFPTSPVSSGITIRSIPVAEVVHS